MNQWSFCLNQLHFFFYRVRILDYSIAIYKKVDENSSI
jgi:hypothetical protein